MKKLVQSLLFVSLIGWNQGNASARAKSAKKVKAPVVGVAWSQEGSGFLNGLNMAMEEINESAKLKYPLKLDIKDDEGSVTQGLLHAEEFIGDHNVVAVIGHRESDITVPASTMYAINGLFMITPNSTAVELTSKGYGQIFRGIPSDRALGRGLVRYFKNKGKKEVMMCYVNSVYGRSLANEFETMAEREGIIVKDRVSYDVGDEREFEKIAKKWKTFDFDSIMFIGLMPRGVNFIKVSRGAFPGVPIIMSETMVNKQLLEEPKSLTEGLVLPALFHKNKPNQRVRTFVEKYREKYGVEPDQESALGYDCMHLLGEAILKAGSFVTADIAKAIRELEDYEGVAQIYNFDEKGDLAVTGDIAMQVISDGKFTLEKN